MVGREVRRRVVSSIQFGYGGHRRNIDDLDGSATWRNLDPEFKRGSWRSRRLRATGSVSALAGGQRPSRTPSGLAGFDRHRGAHGAPRRRRITAKSRRVRSMPCSTTRARSVGRTSTPQRSTCGSCPANRGTSSRPTSRTAAEAAHHVPSSKPRMPGASHGSPDRHTDEPLEGFDPANGHYGLMLLDQHKPTLHRGSPHHDHDQVPAGRACAATAEANHRGIVIDGRFGHQTEDHLIDCPDGSSAGRRTAGRRRRLGMWSTCWRSSDGRGVSGGR